MIAPRPIAAGFWPLLDAACAGLAARSAACATRPATFDRVVSIRRIVWTTYSRYASCRSVSTDCAVLIALSIWSSKPSPAG